MGAIEAAPGRRTSRRVSAQIALALVLALAVALPAGASAAPGDLDPGFNGGQPRYVGASTTPAAQTKLVDVFVDGLGRTVAGGWSDKLGDTRAGLIVRLQPDGTLDEQSFGTGGGWIQPWFAGFGDATELVGVLRDPGGRLGAGFTAGPTTLLAARYQDAGTPDASFATDGVATIAATAGQPFAGAAATGGADGATTLAGSRIQPDDTRRIRIARLDAAGDPAAFGTGGVVEDTTAMVPSFPFEPRRPRLATLPGGAVLVADTTRDGNGDEAIYVARFTAAGLPDPGFGNGSGRVVVQAGVPRSPGGPVFSSAHALTVAPDGSILVGGTASNPSSSPYHQGSMAVVKLTPAGAVDAGFGVRRIPIEQLSGDGEGRVQIARAIALQPDGKIVLAGEGFAGGTGTERLALLRLTPAGAVDASFGRNGLALHTIGSLGGVRVHGVATAGPDKLVVVGETAVANGHTGFIARVVLRAPGEGQPPELRRQPRLAGSPRLGATLTCEAGEWLGAPTSVAVVWERAPRANSAPEDPAWSPIGGASGRAYALADGDVGSRVRCREVAVNGDGSASAPSGSLRVDRDVPVNTSPPALGGIPIAGRALTCDPGLWDNGPDLAFQWLRDGAPIAGASSRTHVASESDRRGRVACRVSAANDVGTAAPATTAAVLVVGAPPELIGAPRVTVERTGPRATDVRLTCATGSWDEDYGSYDVRWLREGSEVAGAVGLAYDATIDDLGRVMTCAVRSTNPVGTSRPARSGPVLVPLPSAGPAGKVLKSGGFGPLDPVNMMALSAPHMDALRSIVLRRVEAALATRRQACAGERVRPGLPEFASLRGRLLSFADTCRVLRLAPSAQIDVTMEGVYWQAGLCASLHDTSAGASTATAARRARTSRSPVSGAIGRGTAVLYGLPLCPRLEVPIPEIDVARPPLLEPAEQAALAATAPEEVLWDVDGDGRVDASCDSTAPVLRSLYERGIYRARAVIVDPASAQTGVYSIADYRLAFREQSPAQRGVLRPAQPFACRTSITPPAEPQLPCTTRVRIGRVEVNGNLCPISMRRLPGEEFDALPRSVQEVLRGQALGADVAAMVERGPVAVGAASVSALRDAATINAVATFSDAKPAVVARPWLSDLARLRHFDLARVQFALDQIYISRGDVRVNGADVRPRNGSAFVLVPSDSGGAIDGVKRMTLAASDATTSLGGLPIGDPGRLSAELPDRLGVASPTLRDANLDEIAASLRRKLDLGPFRLAGQVQVRLADDGSAFIDAQAELPALLTAPGSRPIRTAVTVRADRGGKLRLQGVRLRADRAYLGGVKIKGLLLEWSSGGLVVQGELLFPPVDAGVRINSFRIDGDGNFAELDVDYLAGAGTGIPVGPGLFITMLGGRLSLDPDEIAGRTTISVGPSSGGGCPAVGMTAQFAVHFAPGPFFVRADGTSQVLCIGLARASFYADTTGLVDLRARLDFDAGPLYFGAGFGGTLKLPRWQLDMRGKGGIRGLLSAEIKALVGNLGIAGCGRVELPDPIPNIAGGAGVRFAGGRPPLSYAELAANVSLFTGCDLSRWSPFGHDVRAAQAGRRTFTVGKPTKALPLALVGVGGVPRVLLRAPGGKVYDYTTVPDRLTTVEDSAAIADRARNRLIAFVRGIPGEWTIEPAAGSPAVADVQSATVLEPPRVSGRVAGSGARRTLRYHVSPRPGQLVRFVERSRLGQRAIATVRAGRDRSAGAVRFTTSEGRGTRRTITAEVVQDGLPRANVVVARFTAPSPRVGRPRSARIRRAGRGATISWRAATFAVRHQVVVQTGDGRRVLLEPRGRGRSVRIGGLTRREGAVATVVGISAAGRRGPAATVRLKGSMRLGKPAPAPARRRHGRR